MNGMFFLMQQKKALSDAENEIYQAKREIETVNRQIAKYESDENASGIIRRLQSRKQALEQRIYYAELRAKKAHRFGIR